MLMITMRALVPFRHEGCAVSRGQQIDVPATTAAILRYQRQADFVTTRIVPAESPRKKRTYKRRDLQAES